METKQKLETLFEKAAQFHLELMQIAQEIDSQNIWEAEGAMQDVKAKITDAHAEA